MENQEAIKKILNKKFKSSVFSGYDPTDVDHFFDQVIEYLNQNDLKVEAYKKNTEELKDIINKLNNEIKNLNSQKDQLEKEIETFKAEGYGQLRIIRNKIN